MKPVTKLFTYDDYLTLPDDGKRYETIEGELSMTPAPSIRHQRIQVRLVRRLDAYVTEHDLGEVLCAPIDVVLSMIDIVQPDILFVAKERIHLIAEKNVVGIPNLIVEISSPASSRRDREDKWKLYQKYELPEYWIVDPESQTVDVFTYFDQHLNLVETVKIGQCLRSDQIKDFALEVGEIFRRKSRS